MRQMAAIAFLFAMTRVMHVVGSYAAVVFRCLDDLGFIVATRRQAETTGS